MRFFVVGKRVKKKLQVQTARSGWFTLETICIFKNSEEDMSFINPDPQTSKKHFRK